ncbi:IclR family transcriptional regulator [Conexibacter sp. CPCC 206217]|uniref:IclR family transcriptional regulator n=1 Tax=Conexibacter sp. CPCC 206217 TaxID=3064574 RepID=UPI00272522AB|nr:IclR family transcriptional regulator [Conexibacter sp. CPCC 206217]MDO8213172.1 IclR family transcriptional regulator [Conexibacter sp. CPCC 206217]
MARLVNAASRAFDILEIFLRERGPLSARDLAERLGIPRSTMHELLFTLRERHYLELTPAGYRLGLRAFELGSAYRSGLDLAEEGAVAARWLVDECQETAQVAILDGVEAVYIARVDGTNSLRLISEVGRRVLAHCTGTGKALLSGLSDEELTLRLGDGPLPGLTPNSITDVGQLRRELEQIRLTGFALDDCESNEAVRCVAAPVRDRDQQIVAGVSVSVPIMRWDDQEARLIELVVEAAAQMSRRLGTPELAVSAD